MTTAQIFFSFVAAALVLAGGWIFIRKGLAMLIPTMALMCSGLYIQRLISGSNPYDIGFRWILALDIMLFLHFALEGKSPIPGPGEEEDETSPSNKSALHTFLLREIRWK